MKFLTGYEKDEAVHYFNEAAKEALKSKCLRSKCGTVIVKSNKYNGYQSIIGKGFNSPPGNSENRCNRKSELSEKFKSDKTCCVHAEQRAIMDVLINYVNPLNKHNALKNTRLYFIRLDDNNEIKKSGMPYCTICSKMTLDAGIKEFTLWHPHGICVYNTLEYNELSFNYGKISISKILQITNNKRL